VTRFDQREEGRDELPDYYIPGHGRLSWILGLADTDEGRLGIYRTLFPEATFRKDWWGNSIVGHVDGREYYLNRPGVSWQDVFDRSRDAQYTGMGATAGGGLGLTGGTMIGGPAAGIIGAVAGLAGGGTIGDVLRQRAAYEAGSGQPPSWPKALEAGAMSIWEIGKYLP
jgi:hypothetical protein